MGSKTCFLKELRIGYVKFLNIIGSIEGIFVLSDGYSIEINSSRRLQAGIVGGFAEVEVGDEPIEAGFVPGTGLYGSKEVLLMVVGESVPQVARGGEDISGRSFVPFLRLVGAKQLIK